MSTASFKKNFHEANPRESQVAIQIQLNLMIGPTSQWEVSKAQVINLDTEAHAKDKNLNHPMTKGPTPRPNSTIGQRVTQPTQMWRARSPLDQPSEAHPQAQIHSLPRAHSLIPL